MLNDFANADFGDVRLTKRLLRIVEGLAPEPAASFPDAAVTDASIEATYRFFQNESVTPQRILAPHVVETVRRAEKIDSLVVVAHDTTEFSFSTPREGFGRINDMGRGFFAHYALAIAVSKDGARRPLGVLGLTTLTRTKAPLPNHRTDKVPEQQRESYRWTQMAHEVGDLLRGRVSAVHVMDSEADAYALLSQLVERKDRFVVRLHHDRTVTDEAGDRMKVEEKLPTLVGRFTREVKLSSRAAPSKVRAGRKRNLTRDAREVTLEFAATALTFHKPRKPAPNGPKSLALHVVHVREIDPAPGVEPIDWKLLTTEPIEHVAEIEQVVDAYRARWVVEEFFKALKTGCAFQKRQLESLSALLNALAVFTPIACNLMLLRNLARDEPDLPAATVLAPVELLVLQRHKATKLPAAATIRAAMLAIARLGGHITNNGEPGWIVLGRGYEKLLMMAEGARFALNM